MLQIVLLEFLLSFIAISLKFSGNRDQICVNTGFKSEIDPYYGSKVIQHLRFFEMIENARKIQQKFPIIFQTYTAGRFKSIKFQN